MRSDLGDVADGTNVMDERTRSSSGDCSGTPLDRTIDRIGMGGYQYTLLALCGLGWAADNMWLQAVAIALPRVQVQYGVPSSTIGYLSASTFLGMMLGALLWGTLSDLFGRIVVFNLTMCFSALFGFFAFYVDTFPSLCFANFLLGSAVGGSMPTDGTFALEILPRSKRHLLTSLSVFFSIGSVLAALVALFVIPSNSCPSPGHAPPNSPPCDVNKDNYGWKYLFLILSIITFAFFLARVLFHRFHESPRFLVHSGRKEEAALALTKIAQFNGDQFPITIADVNDDEEQSEGTNILFTSRLRHSIERSYGEEEEGESLLPSSPVSVRSTRPLISRGVSTHSRMSSTADKIKSSGPVTLLRRWFGKPIHAWWSRIVGLLSGEWRQRTLLIWSVWMTLSLAYTMFNVYLPTLLEYRSQTQSEPEEPETTNSLSGPLWEVMVFTLGGCPGALVGAYLVDQAPRRNISKSIVLASVTFITGLSCIAFVMLDGYIAITLSTIAMSLTSTAMWSILYGMTPELFITEVRGTACGTASALSRVGGIAAPLIGGVLVSINPTLVVLASVGVFILSCTLLVLLDRNLKSWSVPTTPPDVDEDS